MAACGGPRAQADAAARRGPFLCWGGLESPLSPPPRGGPGCSSNPPGGPAGTPRTRRSISPARGRCPVPRPARQSRDRAGSSAAALVGSYLTVTPRTQGVEDLLPVLRQLVLADPAHLAELRQGLR